METLILLYKVFVKTDTQGSGPKGVSWGLSPEVCGGNSSACAGAGHASSEGTSVLGEGPVPLTLWAPRKRGWQGPKTQVRSPRRRSGDGVPRPCTTVPATGARTEHSRPREASTLFSLPAVSPLNPYQAEVTVPPSAATAGNALQADAPLSRPLEAPECSPAHTA